jgi:hypothetical protein
MLQTLLTVLLLTTGFLAGLLSRSVRRVAVPLAGLTAAVMVVNVITARVAEAGDWPRSCFRRSGSWTGTGLAWVGARVASRRS